jgi:hypothetical protein
MTDEAIRAALSALRAHDGHPDRDRLLARGRAARRQARQRRTLALGAAGALAAGVIAAALPAGEEPLTARSVLNAAAAAAADQPPERLTGIRYVRIDMHGLVQPGWGTEADRYRTNRPLEFWVPRDGNARVEYGVTEITDLDGRPIDPPDGTPGTGAYKGHLQFDFAALDLEHLPDDPAAAAEAMKATMRKAIEQRTGEPLRDELVPMVMVRCATDLLSFASITAQQRATVFEVLARMPGARALSEDTVELETGLGEVGETQRTTLVIDRRSGALRTRTDHVIKPYEVTYPEGVEVGRDGMAPGPIEYVWDFRVTRDVDAVGDRPS